MAKARSQQKADETSPLPERFVKWRASEFALPSALSALVADLALFPLTVSVDWRAELEKVPRAAAWRAQQLTPNCLFASPLANADGTLSLFEARTTNGSKSLFYSLAQVNAARSAMLDYGVPKAFLKASWSKEWEWDHTLLTDLKRIVFPNPKALKVKLVEMQSQRKSQQAPPDVAPGAEATLTSAHVEKPSPEEPLSAVQGYKKRLASATSLPTPSPSVESSPEPTSASESLPAAKKLKPTLTAAQEAAKLLKQQKLMRQWTSEFDLARRAYARAQKDGGASFLSLDVEFWERQQSCLLEFGWSVTEFVKEADGKVTARRDDQHISELFASLVAHLMSRC